MNGLKRKDLLDIQSLSTEEISLICQSARYFADLFTRSVKTVPILREDRMHTVLRTVDRTRISFELAAKRLSADMINAAVATSSVVKGSRSSTRCTRWRP